MGALDTDDLRHDKLNSLFGAQLDRLSLGPRQEIIRYLRNNRRSTDLLVPHVQDGLLRSRIR